MVLRSVTVVCFKLRSARAPLRSRRWHGRKDLSNRGLIKHSLRFRSSFAMATIISRMAKFGREQSKRRDEIGNVHDYPDKSRIDSVGCHDRLSRFGALIAQSARKMGALLKRVTLRVCEIWRKLAGSPGLLSGRQLRAQFENTRF